MSKQSKRDIVLRALDEYGGDLYAAVSAANCTPAYVRMVAKEAGITLTSKRGITAAELQEALVLAAAERSENSYLRNGVVLQRLSDALRFMHPQYEGSSIYADAGTIVHHMVAARLIGMETSALEAAEELGLSQEAAVLAGEYEDAVNRFAAMLEGTQTWSEVPLGSFVERVGCTIDVVAHSGSRPIIYELKTGASYPWHYVQLAAQQAVLEDAMRAVTRTKVDADGYVVYLARNGMYRAMPQQQWGRPAWRAVSFLRSHNLI